MKSTSCGDIVLPLDITVKPVEWVYDLAKEPLLRIEEPTTGRHYHLKPC